jgi:PAS domain S-box-containing protein
MDDTRLEPEAAGISDRHVIACRAAGVGIWQWDLVTGRMDYSDVARRICGFPAAGEVTFQMVYDITHPDDVDWLKAKTAEALDPARQEPTVFRYRILRADTGELRWLLAHGEARCSGTGADRRAVLFLGTMQDITAQKSAEDALIHNEARLRLALEGATMAVWELDQATDAVTTSPELNRLFGFPDDATPTAEDFRARYAPGERARVEALGAAAAARGEDRMQAVIRTRWPDGTEKHLLMRAQLAPGARPGDGKVIGVLVDMTEEAQREERLAQINAELRHRLQNLVALASALAARSLPRDNALEDYLGRLRALSHATSLMFGAEEGNVEIDALLRAVVAPYQRSEDGPVRIVGPPLLIAGRAATPLAMAIHELATNAVKHGALSVPEGRVALSWTQAAPHDPLVIEWRETGGPPAREPADVGFGMKLLNGRLFHAPDRLELAFAPTGVTCRICIAAPAHA